jgi:two-component system response regulator NreC
MTSVVLVDDHPIVRAGIQRLLAAHPEFTIVGETDQGLVALELVEHVHPDLAIVDLLLPDLNGSDVIRRLRRAAPQTRIVALSMYSDELHVLEALHAGALAYIVKGASPEAMLTALHAALAGRRYLTPPLSEGLIERATSDSPSSPHTADRFELLTDREREVLQWLARGLTYAEIAEQLSISPRTAETHRTNLMRKLNLKTQADITLYAIQRGLIDPEKT